MFTNFDTIICPNIIKKNILKKISVEKKLLNLKFYTLEEFKKKYFGTYKIEAIYYMMKKYNYKYDVAVTYLDNYYFNNELKKELEENNLITKENIKINRIKIIGYNKIDPYILEELKKYDFEIIKDENNYKNQVFEFNTLEDEILFVIDKILDLQKNVNLNDIFLVNVGNEYIYDIKTLFKFHNIPINLDFKKSIYGTSSVKKFLKNLKQNKEIIIEENELKPLIINILNKYAFKEIDDIIIECIENELKNTYIENEKLSCAVGVANIEEIEDSKYYFVLGFNEGILPRIYVDEDFYNDKLKTQFGILTTLEKNILEKDLVANKIKRKNVFLSYRLKENDKDLYPSSLIEELEFEIIKNNKRSYNSNIYNKLLLGSKLDNLIKYNEKDKELDLLYSNYSNIEYLTYNNQFTKIDKNLFYKYINNKIILSYSSIDNYYKCGFRYYISNILKLDKFTEDLNTLIGNLFHYILSIYNEENFDFDSEYEKYIIDKKLNKKEKFFIEKLKSELLFIIDILKQYEKNGELDKSLYEEKIYINIDSIINVTQMGIVDRIMYKEKDNNTYVVIIDYKTGNPNINIDYIDFGLNMQLPMYLYLVKNSKLKNPKFIGFYLEKIIHSKEKYGIDKQKNYKLEGYTIDNEEFIRMFDKTYIDSKMIKSLKMTSNGFSAYSKILSEDEINDLIDKVHNKVIEARDNILNCNFEINPKRIDKDLLGCEYCKYKDLCYKKEENIIDLYK